jgi:hypothetical protein
MQRPRYRIRFRKLDDLRLVGHHDLVRLWERLLRRADVKPAMSEGFHRRPRVNFPSALAVGIGGVDEVMELELCEERDPADLAAALERSAPPGLSIVNIEPMGDGTRFSQPSAAAYEMPLPPELATVVKARIEARRAAAATGGSENGGIAADSNGTNATVAESTDTGEQAEAAVPDSTAQSESPEPEPPVAERKARKPQSNDLRSIEPWPASIRSLDVVDGVLRMNLRLGEAGAVRPRDLLASLELAELENEGVQITRTRVELSP